MASDPGDLPAHSLRQSRKSSNNSNHHATTSNTPLRRVSRGSLAALSASRTREADLYGPTLGHLAPAFAELAEGIEDLAVNCEAVDAINQSLDDFNEAFAGLLFGLRMNAYTSDFAQPPALHNFTHNEKRNARLLQEAQEEAAADAEAGRDDNDDDEADDGDERRQQGRFTSQGQEGDYADGYMDQTFVTLSGDNDARAGPSGSRIGRGGTGIASGTRGRGGTSSASANARGRGRGTIVAGGKTAAQKKKDQLIKFAGPIIQTMPIEFREKQPQRSDAETIIAALKTNSEGYRLQELVKLHPLIPQHRINDCLMALVRAKHAIKVTSKGLLYRLDPLKYPPEP